MLVRFLRRAIFCSASMAIACASPLVEKNWFFTTDRAVTIDLRLTAGAQLDWSASTIAITSVPGNELVQRRALDPSFVRTMAENGVQRILIDGLEVAPWSPTTPKLYRVTLDLRDAVGRREEIAQRVG